jgi:hypothetical protein
MAILGPPFINMMIVLFLLLEPCIHHDQELNTAIRANAVEILITRVLVCLFGTKCIIDGLSFLTYNVIRSIT